MRARHELQVYIYIHIYIYIHYILYIHIGEDEEGRRWRSCGTEELSEADVHAVSHVLDVCMFLPGPGVHVMVQPAPEMLLHTKIEQLAQEGFTQESVKVLQELTVAVDLVHSRNLVMLGSLNEGAFGFIHGRWVLHDLTHVCHKGQVLTLDNWNASAVPAPEATLVSDGLVDSLEADASMDMFLLGLILFKVLVGKPLAPDLPATFTMLRRMRALGSEGDLLIGTGRCTSQVGKYILENTLTLNPQERFRAKDVLMNLVQMRQPFTSLPEVVQSPKSVRERMSTLPQALSPSVTGEAYERLRPPPRVPGTLSFLALPTAP